MNRKQQFLNAVRVLAPDDRFIYETAQQVPEESLPMFPGGAALEFVAAVLRLRQPVDRIPVKAVGSKSKTRRGAALGREELPVSAAVRVRSVERWLKLGEADQALRELEALSRNVWNHPAAITARVEALGAIRHQSEVIVQE